MKMHGVYGFKVYQCSFANVVYADSSTNLITSITAIDFLLTETRITLLKQKLTQFLKQAFLSPSDPFKIQCYVIPKTVDRWQSVTNRCVMVHIRAKNVRMMCVSVPQNGRSLISLQTNSMYPIVYVQLRLILMYSFNICSQKSITLKY